MIDLITTYNLILRVSTILILFREYLLVCLFCNIFIINNKIRVNPLASNKTHTTGSFWSYYILVIVVMVALLGSDRSRLQFLGYRLRLSTWFHDGRPPFEEALPETRHLPSAEGVAESNILSTRQSYNLPSAYRKTLGNKTTLGKDLLCRVPVYRLEAGGRRNGFFVFFMRKTSRLLDLLFSS